MTQEQIKIINILIKVGLLKEEDVCHYLEKYGQN